MIRDAVTCDKPNCMAFMLVPRIEGQDFAAVLAATGWTHAAETGHTCPACRADHYGDGPVLELGECPRCGGRTVQLPGGPSCLYCAHSLPSVVDVLHEEITGDAAEEANAAFTGRLEIGTVTLWQDPNGSGWGATCSACDEWTDFADPMGFQGLCASARIHTASHKEARR